jgi:hypothetical protein
MRLIVIGSRVFSPYFMGRNLWHELRKTLPMLN